MKLFGEGIGIDQTDFDFQEYLQTLGFERPARAFPSNHPVTPNPEPKLTQGPHHPQPLQAWGELEKLALGCQKCPLGQSRLRTVWGQGSLRPKVVFVGDFPGPDDESSGRAFGGPSGELLARMIHAMGLREDEVFLMLAVQCRAPGDRAPTDDERSTCHQTFLREKLRILSPLVVIALGTGASRSLIGEDSPKQGSFFMPSWEPSLPILPTFHPAYLLKNPEAKKAAWSDLQIVMKRLSSLQPMT